MNKPSQIEQDLYALYANIHPSPTFARRLRYQLVNRAGQIKQAQNSLSNRLLGELRVAWRLGLGMAALALLAILITFSMRLVTSEPPSSPLPASQPTQTALPLPVASPTSLGELENEGCWLRYRVQVGDTLTGISLSFNRTVDELLQLNHFAPENTLVVGEAIIIGRADSVGMPCDYFVTPEAWIKSTPSLLLDESDCSLKYVVQSGDTLNGITHSIGLSVEELAELNGMSTVELEMLWLGQQLIVRIDPECKP